MRKSFIILILCLMGNLALFSQEIDMKSIIQLIDFTDRSLLPPVIIRNISKVDVYNTLYDNVDNKTVSLSDSIPLKYHSTYYYSPQGQVLKIEIYSLFPGKENTIDTTIEYIFNPSSLVLKFTTQSSTYTKEYIIEGDKLVKYNKDKLSIELFEFSKNRIIHRHRYNGSFTSIPEEEWIINGNKIEYNKYVYPKKGFSEKAIFENGIYIHKTNEIDGYELIWKNNNEIIKKTKDGKTEIIKYYYTVNERKLPEEEMVIYENGSGNIKRYIYE